MAKVEQYSGNNRQDKEYVYLDEMLTRNLLKLDDIETEGKDDVRTARKEAIRQIQRCISQLENKVHGCTLAFHLILTLSCNHYDSLSLNA